MVNLFRYLAVAVAMIAMAPASDPKDEGPAKAQRYVTDASQFDIYELGFKFANNEAVLMGRPETPRFNRWMGATMCFGVPFKILTELSRINHHVAIDGHVLTITRDNKFTGHTKEGCQDFIKKDIMSVMKDVRSTWLERPDQMGAVIINGKISIYGITDEALIQELKDYYRTQSVAMFGRGLGATVCFPAK